MVIAGLAIVSALLAWRASTAFGAASGLGSQALRDAAQYQNAQTVEDGKIDFGAHLAVLDQEHQLAAQQLFDLANQQRAAGNTSVADTLEAQARVEGAQARAVHANYDYYAGSLNDDGTVSYKPEADRALAVATNTDLRTLGAEHVAAMQRQASALRARAQQGTLAAALFVATMLFLTAANLARRHRRLPALAVGLCAACAGVVVLATAGLP